MGARKIPADGESIVTMGSRDRVRCMEAMTPTPALRWIGEREVGYVSNVI